MAEPRTYESDLMANLADMTQPGQAFGPSLTVMGPGNSNTMPEIPLQFCKVKHCEFKKWLGCKLESRKDSKFSEACS